MGPNYLQVSDFLVCQISCMMVCLLTLECISHLVAVMQAGMTLPPVLTGCKEVYMWYRNEDIMVTAHALLTHR